MPAVRQWIDVPQTDADKLRVDAGQGGGEHGERVGLQVEIEQLHVVAAAARGGGHDPQAQRRDDLRPRPLHRRRLYHENAHAHQSTRRRPRYVTGDSRSGTGSKGHPAASAVP